MAAYDTRLVTYLGQGPASSLPGSPNVPSNALAIFYADDTDVLYVWNSNTSNWDIAGGGSTTQFLTAATMVNNSVYEPGFFALEALF